ncbi:MAG: aldo/keto reductase [Anaerolineae bacterium]|nr:aldo/keto reductase [Anaerolineae bacterium]
MRRLQTDHIDVYWLHAVDATTPIEETLRAMDDLIRVGKVRYIGCCNFAAWQLCEALWRSDVRGLHAFAAIQNQYSLLNRWELEPELMPLCKKYGLGIMVYSPLAIGLLTGQFRRGQPPMPGTPWADHPHHSAHFAEVMTERVDALIQLLIDIGRVQNKTPAQIAIAWVLDHPEVNSAIIGPDKPEHVDEVLGALDCKLTAEERVRLDLASEVKGPVKFA